MLSFKKIFSGTVYSIDIPTHLIQSIRVYQSLMEAGIKLNIPAEHKSTFDYLSSNFKVNYEVQAAAALPLDVEISHSEPYVRIGSHKQILVFPAQMLKLCKSFWANQRDVDYLFVGLLNDERKSVLSKWQKNIEQLSESREKPNITINDSRRGRQFPEKAWDEPYYKSLANAKFTLCPNGDFVWTYRFFEAALCGSIPVIEEFSSLYEGFNYHMMNDDKQPVWSIEKAEENYARAVELLAPPQNLKTLLALR